MEKDAWDGDGLPGVAAGENGDDVVVEALSGLWWRAVSVPSPPYLKGVSNVVDVTTIGQTGAWVL